MMKFSFVVPIYNDAYLAEEFCQEYSKVFQQHLGMADITPHVELIFVNDGSIDNSAETLAQPRGMSSSRNAERRFSAERMALAYAGVYEKVTFGK